MAPFFVLPLLLNRSSRSAGYACPCGYKCPCHERWYKRGWMPVLLTMLVSLVIVAVLITFIDWTVDRDFPKDYNPGDIDTYAHYLRHCWIEFVDVVRHLW